MNFLVAQMISCYNPFETKERNLIKIYSFEKGIHMKAISKMNSLILKYRHAWVLLYGLIYMPWFCYLEKRQTISRNRVKYGNSSSINRRQTADYFMQSPP